VPAHVWGLLYTVVENESDHDAAPVSDLNIGAFDTDLIGNDGLMEQMGMRMASHREHSRIRMTLACSAGPTSPARDLRPRWPAQVE
jgi:hypothetical protein